MCKRYFFLLCPLMLIALTSCKTPQQSSEALEYSNKHNTVNSGNLEDCLSTIHDARNSNALSPELSFVRGVSSSIFSCERIRGEQMSFLGKTIRVRGKAVHSGYGYVLSDPVSLRDIFSKGKMAKSYVDPKNRFEINITERNIPIPEYGTLPVHVISGKGKGKAFLIPEKVIGMIAGINFKSGKERFTLFLWVHGIDLTDAIAVSKFRELLPNIIPPKPKTKSKVRTALLSN